MKLGEVIRKYRKEKNMTQEEMANRLGVTAPAVNKWENGNSFPDIMLLSPIARLLEITTDVLLSFRDELTAEEIGDIVQEMDSMMKDKTYQEVFGWAKKKLEQYPNCHQLIWQVASILDAQRMFQELPNAEEYDEYISSLYVRALETDDELLRSRAADSLFGFYMRKKEYDKAEKYLEYFSLQNPERKRKQAELYSKTNRIHEAYKTYEELFFSYYQMTWLVLQDMYILAMGENDMERVHMLVGKQEEIARCFEMGRYYEVSPRLEIAILEKDADTVIEIMREMLHSVENMCGYLESPLYEHMEFKPVNEEFLSDLKSKLLQMFRDEETFGFLKDNEMWKSIALS